ncbi:hypothetical protein SAMN04515621_1551 [Erythrobacter sp. HL-111]|nr:hypothetical protein SAMN04515621_1551 [Erythrobacter sp. HL-111]
MVAREPVAQRPRGHAAEPQVPRRTSGGNSTEDAPPDGGARNKKVYKVYTLSPFLVARIFL